MKTAVHAVASAVATLCIATFLLSTISVELFGSNESIALVKQLIVEPGLYILVPAIAITGASGFALSAERKGRLVSAKKKRMPWIAFNGLFILVPSAIFLNLWAAEVVFDSRFYAVQLLELLAGSVNLTLMSMNVRDGLRLTGKYRPKNNITQM